ncbi:hypothetical protein LTR84_008562 [Exophiala bonariae]|uniref:Major facilitator superfamily (MFS) profile domain-containing protein n=1 Tax=Exophiala bonariae TaxID=1690606 RepID=A0AAV9MYU1_9EURO|nr:hypothetical protein LTR84_008562 [Exophiala bonariae]
MAGVCFGTARIDSVKGLYATNLICGLAGSTNETIVQMTIVDLFFIHQRSRMYATYSVAATIGSFLVPLAAGAQAASQGWRWSYWTLAIVNTVIFFCFLIFFEESKYVENSFGQSVLEPQNDLEQTTPVSASLKGEVTLDLSQPQPLRQTLSDTPNYTVNSYRQRMRLITPTRVNIWQLFYRPVEVLFCLPAVLFSAIQYGFILAWCAVFTSAQAIIMPYEPWNFNETQMGLLMLAPFIGLVIGLAVGGYVGDKMIVYFSKRNNGIYEPEMRLYAQIVPCIVSTAGFLVFGIYLSEYAHWAKCTVGTLIYGLGWGMGLNSTTYAIDSYSGVIGEAFVSISFVRNIFSVILLFALEPWFAAEGLRNSFITMGVLCFVIQLLFIPMIIFGKRARVITADRYNRMASAVKAYSRG